jgi:hypothetical protein
VDLEVWAETFQHLQFTSISNADLMWMSFTNCDVNHCSCHHTRITWIIGSVAANAKNDVCDRGNHRYKRWRASIVENSDSLPYDVLARTPLDGAKRIQR